MERETVPFTIYNDPRVENLAMMLRRMIWMARKQTGDTSLKALAGIAEELLRRYGLEGSPLRANQTGGDDE